MKSYTDFPQSQTLAKILSDKTADMCWERIYDEDHIISDYRVELLPYRLYSGLGVPCWSLAALLEQLPYEVCDEDGNSFYLSMCKEDYEYQLVYSDPYCMFDDIETDTYDDFVDACVEMILKLHELKLL